MTMDFADLTDEDVRQWKRKSQRLSGACRRCHSWVGCSPAGARVRCWPALRTPAMKEDRPG